MKLSLLLLATGCSTNADQPSVPAKTSLKGEFISFSTLAEGDFIDLDFRSTGCFHKDHVTLTFKRRQDQIRVTGIDKSMRYNDKAKKALSRNTSLNPVILSDEDCVMLDRLLEFYRNLKDHDAMCSTTDSVSLSCSSSQNGLKTEAYQDATCATYHMKDILSLVALTSRMGMK